MKRPTAEDTRRAALMARLDQRLAALSVESLAAFVESAISALDDECDRRASGYDEPDG